VITERINPDYSATTTLEFTVDDVVYEGLNKGQLDNVFAGVPVTKVAVVLGDPTAIWGVNGAYLKIVADEITVSDAMKGACEALAQGYDVVNYPWWDSAGAPTIGTIGMNTQELEVDPTEAPDLTFRKGGMYKVCYSELGTFVRGPADPLDITIVVSGIYTACTGMNCLGNKVNYCYQLKLRTSVEGSCVFDYSDVTRTAATATAAIPEGEVYGNGQGYYGTEGKASWSSAFYIPEGAMTSLGEVLSVTPQPCTTQPHSSICPSGDGCAGSARYFTINQGESGTEKSLQLQLPQTMPNLEKEKYVAFTVAMCYCPDYDSGGIADECNENGDFVQQVGIIHFFAVKGCHVDDTNCLDDVSGIMPQYDFKLWVLCPTDVCMTDDRARVKLIPSHPDNDRPWWDNNGCRGTPETPLLVSPPNCYGPQNCSVTGGNRQDYKHFGSPNEPFLFRNGETNYEMRNFHDSVEYDVCFCLPDSDLDTDCMSDEATWMKAGIFRFAPLRLVSAATDTADKPNIEYVNYAGVVALNLPPADHDVLGLQDGGVIKILMDTQKNMGDFECGKANYDNALVEGLTATTAGSDFRGKASEEHGKLVFNNGNPARTLTVKDPGIIAICYCAITIDGICADQNYWKLLTHLTIKGPDPSQTWTFSTNVVFRFEFTGFQLADTNTLRIIETDAKCTDNEGNPNQADTSIYYSNPGNPTQVSNNPGSEWNFPTTLLTSERVRCNRVGECERVYVKKFEVIDEFTSELTFTSHPDLVKDDVITLDGLACGSPCTAEQLAEAQGVFHFADADDNDKSLPDTYQLGHKVTPVPDTVDKYRINLGWSKKFRPVFEAPSPGARWVRTNRASTREEVLGKKEKSNLKVCWSFGGNGKYVMEMGRINLRDPTQMVKPFINLSTRAQTETDDVKAPVIVSFQTTTQASGLTYSTAEGSMQLKLVFTDTRYFEAFFTDGTSITTVESEDEVVEATQEICGRFILETWSDNMAHGFPIPKGCYYRVIGNSANSQEMKPEFGIVFEEKNGLRAGYNYQIVMLGSAKHKLRADDPEAEGQYMEIYSMDDVVRNPYGAVELGIAQMSTSIGKPPERTDPQFGPRGFTIVGGYAGVVELDSDVPLKFELRGGNGDSNGRIHGSAWLKIYLSPLTQWTTGVSCDAHCLQGGENPFACGEIQSCVGRALVEGFQNNYVMMQLPDWNEDNDLFAERKQVIEVGGLTLPSGAIYPTTYGAELTRRESPDKNPHYTRSVGDLVWKAPGRGRILARLVNTVGDGNLKPFKGDGGNVLYVQLMFAGVLRAAKAGDAGFKITLPVGYDVLDVGGAPDTLYVFDTIPQGRGTLDPKGWNIKGNTIEYSFEENYAIFSGSSLYVMIKVNNPTLPLKDSDKDNRWYLEAYGNGEGSKFFSPPIDPFVGVMEGYSSNAAVLGILQEQVIQPTGFAPSTVKVSRYQLLRVYFRSEQNIRSGGGIGLFAPPIWEFGETPESAECDARDLERNVYATGPFESVYRLPIITDCVAGSTPDSPTIRHRAFVSMEGRLEAMTLYAFQIMVVNPMLSQIRELDELINTPFPEDMVISDDEKKSMLSKYTWRIATLDPNGKAVDGSYDAVPVFPDGSGTLGAYKEQFEPDSLTLSLGPMLPSCLHANQACKMSHVTIRFRLPEGADGHGAMRVTAPVGLDWGDIKELTAPSDVSKLPKIQPMVSTTRKLTDHEDYVDGNKLYLAAREYDSGSVIVLPPFYGFTMPITIPMMTPTKSTNGFYVEIGWDADLQDKQIAGFVLSEPVRALLNPSVRYNYNVVGKENTMQFEVELISSVPASGALTIGVPPKFRFPKVCRPSMLKAHRDNFLPDGFSCAYEQSADGESGTIIITPASSGLEAKLYIFTIVGQNPLETSKLQVDTMMPCGFSVCWRFATLEKIDDPRSYRDKPTYAVGFSINRKMIQARLPLIASAVRAGTERNDRPMSANEIIFSFSLNDDVREDSVLVLRGPYGFVFAEDCKDNIVTAEDKVFGEGNKWPPAYDPWEDEASILACEGKGTDAVIQIAAGLIGEKKYAFRIGVQSNPTKTPEDQNQWVVDFGSETSEPFDGFTLWTFTEVLLDPVSRARSQKGVDVDSVGNAVKLTFKPYNFVTAAETGACYRLSLPDSFRIVHVNFECPMTFESMPFDDEEGLYRPGVMFTTFDINCRVDPDHNNVATMRLSEKMVINNDRPYRMSLEVYNPAMTSEERRELMLPDEYWSLESFAADEPLEGEARDLITIPSYEVSPVLQTWTFRNIDVYTGKPQVNGKTDVIGLQLIMEFPDTLAVGDTIEIEAPPGFILEEEYGICRNAIGVPNIVGVNALANSPAKCDGRHMSIMVMERSPVAKFAQTVYSVDTTNPAQNLAEMDNYWKVKHMNRADKEMSSHIFKGWIIIPQLESVMARVVGPRTAASSENAAIEFSFRAVSTADSFYIQAVGPVDQDTGETFDFSSAICRDPKLGENRLMLIQAKGEAEILAYINSGDVVSLLVERITFPRGGGPTMFNLATYTGGSGGGKKQDEKREFTEGFRLPGYITVSRSKMESIYALDPGTYPIQSMWSPRLGVTARVEVRFYTSIVIPAGSTFHINGDIYNLLTREFNLVDQSKLTQVPVSLWRLVGNDARYIVNMDIRTNVMYAVQFYVVAPTDVSQGNGNFLLEFTDDEALPIATQDSRTEGFQLVVEMDFKVTVERSPPSTLIPLKLNIDPKGSRPTELQVYAPAKFNFTADCLIDGPPEVVSCAPKKAIFGRETAVIVFTEDGLVEPPKNLRIQVLTSESTPQNADWLVEGIFTVNDAQVGWGEDPYGIQIYQMRDTSVMYAGATGILSEFAVWFYNVLELEAGGILEVRHPPTFGFFCDSFMQVSLPGEVACQVDDGRFRLAFNNTVAPGEYSFSITADIPADAAGESKEFSIFLIDRHGDTQDAKINFGGPMITDQLIISVPGENAGFKWYPEEIIAGEVTYVEFTLNFEQDVPTDPSDPPKIGEILFTIPRGFVHDIRTISDVTNVNDLFEPPGGPIIDYTQMDRVRIKVDNGQYQPPTAGAGNNTQPTALTIKGKTSYAFRFPVIVPRIIDPWNIWVVSVCDINGGCSSPEDSGVKLNFPLAGFQVGDIHPLTARRPQADAGMLSLLAVIFLALV
jgi:hypothetical protein